jgi:hypothetical protein
MLTRKIDGASLLACLFVWPHLLLQALAQVCECLTTFVYETEKAKLIEPDHMTACQQVLEEIKVKYQNNPEFQDT